MCHDYESDVKFVEGIQLLFQNWNEEFVGF